MANTKSITQATQPATSAVDLPPIHRAHSWLTSRTEMSPSARLAQVTIDVALGAQVIAEVARNWATAIDAVEHPVFGANDMDRLLGLMHASLGLLAARAEAHITTLNNSDA